MFLFGNTTQFKQVEAATSDMLIGPDWAANMEIWDAIQRSHDGGKDYLKAMEKRMGHKNPHVVDLTLELLGSCVKNCGGRFHQHVHAQSFLNSLVRVSRRSAPGGNEQAVRDKALVMIMAWAEAFERIRGFPNFATTYNKLRQAGVQFPARDMNEMAPVFTPERTVEERAQQPQPLPAGAQQQQQQQPQQFQRLPPEAYHPFSSVTPAYIDKVKGELRQVMEYVGIVQDMLLAADSPETAAREDSLQQLIQTLREVQSRLIRILVEVNDEKLVDVVVSVNEHVGVVLQWHRAVMEGHEFTVPELPPPAGLASDAPAVPESGGAEAKADGEEAPAPSDEFQNLALERHNEPGDEDAADGADKAFDDLAAGGAAPAAAAAAAAPAHRKTPSQELEELLGLSGPGDASGAGGEVNVSEKEFEDLLGLTDNNSGAAEPGAAPDQADPAILDDL